MSASHTNTLESGRFGEEIVLKHLNKNGVIAKKSSNEFDKTCDIIVYDKLKMEVKFQKPNHNRQCFSVRYHQLAKVLTAPIIVFGSIPPTNPAYHTETDGKVYYIRGSDIDPDNFYFMNGINEKMLAIPFEKTTEWFSLTSEEIEYLQKMSQSDS